MEKMICRRCGVELDDMGGTFYCRNCQTSYVLKNNELYTLECENCGGSVSDRGDYFQCEVCGAKYEKTIPDPEPVSEILLPESFFNDYDKAFEVKNAEEIISLGENLKNSGAEALKSVCEIEDEEDKVDTLFAVCAKFLGAISFLVHKTFDLNKLSHYEMKEKSFDEMMKSLNSFQSNLEKFTGGKKARQELEYFCALFLVELNKIADEITTKLVAERAAEIFSGSLEKDALEEYCPNIAEIISFCEEKIEESREELNNEYWQEHQAEFSKLTYEKAVLEKQRKTLSQMEKEAIAKENEKVEAIKKEYNEAERRCYEVALQRSELKFFQKKKKEELRNESHRLVEIRLGIEKKLEEAKALAEERIKKIRKKAADKHAELSGRISEIKRELDRNHYPGEELFVEFLNYEMEKTMTNKL